MDVLDLVLIVVGVALIAIGILVGRGPLATIRRLDATAANLERYDAWRGKRASLDDDGPTGADEMRAQMRQRLILWGAVIAVGVALLLIGLLRG